MLYSGTMWQGEALPARMAANEQTIELLFRVGVLQNPLDQSPCGSQIIGRQSAEVHGAEYIIYLVARSSSLFEIEFGKMDEI